MTIYPWQESVSEVYENQWVITDQNTVFIDKEEIDVSEYNLNIKGIQELFRSWA